MVKIGGAVGIRVGACTIVGDDDPKHTYTYIIENNNKYKSDDLQLISFFNPIETAYKNDSNESY